MVPSDFPERMPATIALVGEAPGENEVEEGRPFVGPSGQLLNELLLRAGLDRRDLYIGNVFSEKAEGNDVGPWMKDTEAGRAVWKPELERLGSELATVRPNVIVPLGGTALWALTGKDNISSYRGAVMSATRTAPGVKLVPTLHPAALMREYTMFTVVVEDLRKAKRESEFPEIRRPRRRLLLDPTLEDLWAHEDKLLNADLLSVDIETGWGQITMVGMAWSQEEGLVVPFLDLRQKDRNYWRTAEQELQAWKFLRRILHSTVPKLGQNFGSYDALWLLERGGIRVRNFLHDTRLMHHALYPQLPKDLAFMGAAYGNQGAWKTWGNKAGAETEKVDD